MILFVFFRFFLFSKATECLFLRKSFIQEKLSNFQKIWCFIRILYVFPILNSCWMFVSFEAIYSGKIIIFSRYSMILFAFFHVFPIFNSCWMPVSFERIYSEKMIKFFKNSMILFVFFTFFLFSIAAECPFFWSDLFRKNH